MKKSDFIVPAIFMYAIASFLNGKVYNDFQKHIEKHNQIIKDYPTLNTTRLTLENKTFQKTVDATKHNPVSFPFVRMYDLAEKRY